MESQITAPHSVTPGTRDECEPPVPADYDVCSTANSARILARKARFIAPFGNLTIAQFSIP